MKLCENQTLIPDDGSISDEFILQRHSVQDLELRLCIGEST